MAYLRDNKEMSLKALVARHAEALGTLRTAQHKGEKSAGYVWNKIAGDLGRKHTLGLYLEEPKRPSSRFSHKKLPILHVYLDSQALIQDFSTDVAIYQANMAYEGLPVQAIKFHLSKKINAKEKQVSKTPGYSAHSAQNSPNARKHSDAQNPPTAQKRHNLSHQQETRGEEPFSTGGAATNNLSKEQAEAAWILRHKKGAHLTPTNNKKSTPFNELPPLNQTEIQFIQRNVHTLPEELKRTVISAMSARLRRQKDN